MIGAYLSVGVVDVLTDVMVFALPIPMLLKLQMPQTKRVGLLALFGLGLITIAASLGRTIIVGGINFAGAGQVRGQVMLLIWSVVEPSVAIMVSCGIIMKPFFDKFGPKISGWTSRSLSRFTRSRNSPSKPTSDQAELQAVGGSERRFKSASHEVLTLKSQV